MTTIKEHIDEIGDVGNKVIGYAVINSMICILSEAADELEDDEISIFLEDLQSIIIRKQEQIMNMTVLDKNV